MKPIIPKILIFIDWYLPGYKAGGPVTSNANLVAHLKDEFEFYIITRNTDYCEYEPYDNVKVNEWNDIEDNVHIYYFSKDRLSYRNLKKVANSVDYDVAYINGVYSLYFSIFPLLLAKHKKRIVASRGMISAHSLTVGKTKKRMFFRFAKLLNLYGNTLFHITTTEEDFFIKKLLGKRIKTCLAPNLPRMVEHREYQSVLKQEGELKLVSAARIAPEKNTVYAIEILSKCAKKNISLDLYGTIYDQNYWSACQQKINQLPEIIQVSYKGSVASNELNQVYAQAHFLFLPTRGENFGHSIIESLSYGCPVIISNQTPWISLKEKGIGWDIPLEEPGQFVEVLEQCVAMNQEEYNRMSKCAYEYARKIVNNEEVIAQNRQLLLT